VSTGIVRDEVNNVYQLVRDQNKGYKQQVPTSQVHEEKKSTCATVWMYTDVQYKSKMSSVCIHSTPHFVSFCHESEYQYEKIINHGLNKIFLGGYCVSKQLTTILEA